MLRMPGSKYVGVVATVTAVALLASSCGGSGGSKNTTTTTAGGKGGDMVLLANTAPSGSPDPQVNYTLQEWQLLIFTHDGLVAYKRVAGEEGTKKVPDLAESLPTPTDGGKTFTFTLRPGIKFSNGQTVTGQDVKATFERLFKIGNSPNAGTWYNVIEGGDACVKTPKTCDLSKGIVVDGNKVTFHLTRGDPEFLDKLAVPFAFILPASTPTKNVDIPPPGTGPYKWAEYAPSKQIKLVRNPNFKVWSKDAQPPGNPDTITEKFGLSVEAEVHPGREQPGRLGLRPAPGRSFERARHQVLRSGCFVNPLTAVYYFAFNVNEPPFNNLKARQACQLRDRPGRAGEELRRAEHGRSDLPGAPAELPRLRAVLPVHEESGQRQVDGSRHGQGEAAHRAVGHQGCVGQGHDRPPSRPTRRTGCTSWGCSTASGTRPRFRLSRGTSSTRMSRTRRTTCSSRYSSWYQDYPAASDFLNILLGCDSFHPNSNSSPNIAGFCDEQIQADMDQAGTTGITDPAAGEQDVGSGGQGCDRPGAVGRDVQPEATSTSSRRASRVTSSARSGTSCSIRPPSSKG